MLDNPQGAPDPGAIVIEGGVTQAGFIQRASGNGCPVVLMHTAGFKQMTQGLQGHNLDGPKQPGNRQREILAPQVTLDLQLLDLIGSVFIAQL